MKNKIKSAHYEGERPLYKIIDTFLEDVLFLSGESALKHCSNLRIKDSIFQGKYPMWHCQQVEVQDLIFEETARAAIWYTSDFRMKNSTVDAPKMFRACDGVYLSNVKMRHAAECFWNCRNIKAVNCEINEADYVFMNCENIQVDRLNLQGNYSFQDAKNVVIRNSVLYSKDAFWNTENITVYNSTIVGEYLGWHSKGLRLVNCIIESEQALCYADDLILENCTLYNTNLAFEYSSVQATVLNSIHSIKNPGNGFIQAPEIGQIILDENCPDPNACEISTITQQIDAL